MPRKAFLVLKLISQNEDHQTLEETSVDQTEDVLRMRVRHLQTHLADQGLVNSSKLNEFPERSWFLAVCLFVFGRNGLSRGWLSRPRGLCALPSGCFFSSSGCLVN